MRPIVRRLIRYSGMLGIFAALLVACGGTSSAASGNQFSTEAVAQQVAVSTDPSGALRWDKQDYTAHAGDVTFVVKNPSQITHQFSVEGNGVNYTSPNLKPGSTNNYTIKGLPAGAYQIVCNYPGHKLGGMVAKLTVVETTGGSAHP
jgi:uncharacterized cupredoxin-like copper-binding protein